jgi:hypothetical protein
MDAAFLVLVSPSFSNETSQKTQLGLPFRSSGERNGALLKKWRQFVTEKSPNFLTPAPS